MEVQFIWQKGKCIKDFNYYLVRVLNQLIILEFNWGIQMNNQQQNTNIQYRMMNQKCFNKLKNNKIKHNLDEHIIKILGIQVQAESIVLVVMEKGKGNILELINSNQSLSLVQKIKLFEQMVEGVIELHNLGYLHRDLKPENFVYFENENKDYKVKLIDFGLAINEFTTNSKWLGTLNYMAPELMLTGETYDKTTDIWSLGIILYELLVQKKFLQSILHQKLKQNQLNQAINQIKNSNNKCLIYLRSGQIIKQTKLMIQNNQRRSQSTQCYKKIVKRELIWKFYYKQQRSIFIQLSNQKNKTYQNYKKQDNRQLINWNSLKIQNLNQKLEIVNNINTEYQEKQQLSSDIKDELIKCEEKIMKIEERLQYKQNSQTKEMLKRHYSEIIQESEQQIQANNLIMEKILKQIILLELSIEEQELKKKQEEELKKEQEQYQFLLLIVRQLFSSQITQINKISQEICFYQRIQLQIFGEEQILYLIKQHKKITQDIQELEQQDKIILQLDSLQQKMNIYSQFNNTLEGIQQAQNSLKISIEEANKSIEKTDRQYLNYHHKQINELNDQLKDLFETFQYQLQHQKYTDKINEIISDIAQVCSMLKILEQLISSRTLEAYQEYKTKYIQIQQFLSDKQQQHKQLHQQIYNDQCFEQINGVRINKLQKTKEQLEQFKYKMNQLKNQIKNLINNQYCNNEQTSFLINNELIKFDKKIDELEKQFDNFNKFNTQNYNSCEIISNQIDLLEEFQRKLNEENKNQIEQVDQFKLIIENKAAEHKSKQEKKILNLKNQLQIKYRIFQNVLFQINQFENLEYQENMRAKYRELEKQLEQEIEILKEYLRVQYVNQKLLQN